MTVRKVPLSRSSARRCAIFHADVIAKYIVHAGRKNNEICAQPSSTADCSERAFGIAGAGSCQAGQTRSGAHKAAVGGTATSAIRSTTRPYRAAGEASRCAFPRRAPNVLPPHRALAYLGRTALGNRSSPAKTKRGRFDGACRRESLIAYAGRITAAACTIQGHAQGLSSTGRQPEFISQLMGIRP